MAKKRKRNANSVSVDLSGVETSKSVKPGIHRVAVQEVTQETSQSDKPYLKFVFEVIEGPSAGGILYHNASLQPQALFTLKSVLEALGLSIPKKAFDLDLDTLIDLECTVEVDNEIYEGKKKPRIIDFIESGEDDDEDYDDEDEDDEDEDYEDMTLKELKAIAKERGIKSKKSWDEEDYIEALEEDDED